MLHRPIARALFFALSGRNAFKTNFFYFWLAGKFAGCNLHFYNLPLNRTHLPLKLKFSESSRRHFFSRKDLILSNGRKELSSYFTHQLASHYTSIRASSGETLHYGQSSPISEGEGVSPTSTDANNFVSLQLKQKKFRNRFLNFVRLGSVIDNAAESFFKSEIRRRLFVTAILIVISRIGYFIPLPGFDRRLIPEDYLSFVSGSVSKLFFHLDLYFLSYWSSVLK